MKERIFDKNSDCISDVEKRNICSTCVKENYLSSKIRRLKQQAICYYCNDDGPVITIAGISDEIATVLKSYYQQTSPEPSELDLAMIRHRIREWEREGEPVIQVIRDVSKIKEGPAEHIRRVLADRYWHATEFSQEGPFDQDAQYVESDVDDKKHHERWSDLENDIKINTRFFSSRMRATLDSIFEVLNDYQYKTKSLIIEAPAKLYRARMFESDNELAEALKRPDLHLGPPPPAKAQAGRMNASGISVFYGATSARVAISEVRPPVGSLVLVGAFKLIRKILLLDVNGMDTIQARSSVFDPKTIARQRKAKFLRTLKNRITKAVTPYDEPSEYLITQIIAEYLADRSDLHLDGIMYPSIQTQTQTGNNVMLFYRSSRLRSRDIPDNTQIEARFEHHDMEYTVSEQTPAVDRSGKFKCEDRDKDVDLVDRRDVTLEIDLENLKVHSVRAATYDTESYNVSRYRFDDSDDSEF